MWSQLAICTDTSLKHEYIRLNLAHKRNSSSWQAPEENELAAPLATEREKRWRPFGTYLWVVPSQEGCEDLGAVVAQVKGLLGSFARLRGATRLHTGKLQWFWTWHQTNCNLRACSPCPSLFRLLPGQDPLYKGGNGLQGSCNDFKSKLCRTALYSFWLLRKINPQSLRKSWRLLCHTKSLLYHPNRHEFLCGASAAGSCWGRMIAPDFDQIFFELCCSGACF